MLGNLKVFTCQLITSLDLTIFRKYLEGDNTIITLQKEKSEPEASGVYSKYEDPVSLLNPLKNSEPQGKIKVTQDNVH